MRDAVSCQPAFMLHARPYRETSRIVELLSHDHGRVAVVQRGARGKRRCGGLMQFMPLLVGWSGRGNLKTLTAAESDGPAVLLAESRLASGLYANELLMRLLRPMDAHEGVYCAYSQLVEGLARGVELQPLLRSFECRLLQEIGYGISFRSCGDSGAGIDASAGYGFAPERGFYALSGEDEGWPGWVILAIGAGNFSEPAVRAAAKQILRLALAPHLGDRPLESRLLVQVHAGKQPASAGE